MEKYINYPQPEKFPLAVKMFLNEPDREHVEEDIFRKHEYSKLCIVRHGTAEHRIKAGRANLGTGDVLVLHPGTENSFSNTVDFELFAIIFDATVPLPLLEASDLPLTRKIYPGKETVDQLNPIARIPAGDRDLCENLVRRLSYETHRQRLGKNIMLPLLFMELIVYLARGDSTETEKERLWLIRSPAEYLNEHYQEPLDLKKLASLAHMSDRSLFRHFQKMLGMSPNRYLHKIRIQKACELLEGTHFSIGEIALRCGFCDANHLTKIFRSVTGTTPFSFRREKQLKTR